MQNKRPLNAFILAMMNVSVTCNIANLAVHAQNGFSAILYLLVAIVSFLIPVALISAELATGWPQRGGVYIWVKEAMGSRFGFLAVWLQWIENVIWYPTALSFAAATFAYIFNPSLANNKIYIMSSVLIIFWTLTLVNFLGMKISGWISSICAVLGTLLPGILIIVFGILWIIMGHHSNINFTLSDITNSNISEKFGFFVGILTTLVGLEVSANHAREVQNPKKNYPIALLISAMLVFTIYTFGSLSIAIVVNKSDMNLASASLEALNTFFCKFNICWAMPSLASLVAIGAFGMISTWMVGPSRGILATAEHGELPPILQKTNKKAMPTTLLIIQAIIVSILSALFLVTPNISSSYWILLCLTGQLYLLMYILMFIASVILRYKKPDVERTFKIPVGNSGIWITASLGIISSAFALIMGFFPPEPFQKINIWFFDSFLLFCIILFITIPLIISYKKHPSWHHHYLKNNAHINDSQNQDLK